MKKNHIVQFDNKEFNVEKCDEMIKQYLVENKIKVKDVEAINTYIKPSEEQVYFVINLKDGTGICDKLF